MYVGFFLISRALHRCPVIFLVCLHSLYCFVTCTCLRGVQVCTVTCPIKETVLSHCWDEGRPVRPLLAPACPAETGVSRRQTKLGPGVQAWGPTFAQACPRPGHCSLWDPGFRGVSDASAASPVSRDDNAVTLPSPWRRAGFRSGPAVDSGL